MNDETPQMQDPEESPDMGSKDRPDRHLWLSVSHSLLARRLRKRINSGRNEDLPKAGPDPAATHADERTDSGD